jgi:hypothetical protein
MKRFFFVSLLATTFGCDKGTTNASIQTGPITFTDVTQAAGVGNQTSFCVVFQDLDGDNHPDIVQGVPDAQGRFTREIALYRNTADGKFSKSSLMVPMTTGGAVLQGCTTTDYDGDGKLDLLLLFDLPTSVALYHNMGGMQFEDVTATTIPAGAVPASTTAMTDTASTFDYDNDGHLDLIIGFFAAPLAFLGGCPVTGCTVTDTGQQCTLAAGSEKRLDPVLLHNKGGTGFEVVTAPGAGDPPDVNGIGTIDWNGDGYTDLFFADDFGPSRLYLNQAGQGWKEVLGDLGTNTNFYNSAMGVAFQDFDRDGLWDLYVANLGSDELFFSLPGATGGKIEYRSAQMGVSAATQFHSAWDPIAQDFDHDGFVDVFLNNCQLAKDMTEMNTLSTGCGPGMPSVPQNDFILTNQGGKSFKLSTLPNTGKAAWPGFAMTAAADYDGDGDIDIIEFNLLGNPSFRLLRNDTTMQGHWLQVHLKPTNPKSNSFGYGSVVTLKDGGTYLDKRAYGPEGGTGKNDLTVHFGLGGRTSVGPIVVHWPSGNDQTIPAPIKADQVLTITEQ